MSHVIYKTSFEVWNLAYLGYFLWITGLLFFLLFMTDEEPMKIIKFFCINTIGKICCIWMIIALVASAFAWPLLILGPFVMVSFGAPINAGIIAGIFFIFCFCLSGKLLINRMESPYT